jgi:hypothetical protein
MLNGAPIVGSTKLALLTKNVCFGKLSQQGLKTIGN